MVKVVNTFIYPMDDELSTKVREKLGVLLLLFEPNDINRTVHCMLQLFLNAESAKYKWIR